MMMAHTILDDGADACPSCENVVPSGRHCGSCGSSLIGGSEESKRPIRDCPNCRHPTRQTYCESCGSRVVPRMIEKLERKETTIGDEVLRAMAIGDRWNEQKRKAREARLAREAEARRVAMEAARRPLPGAGRT